MQIINQLWRGFATALGFVIFGFFGVLFKIVFLPYTRKPTGNDINRQLQARRFVRRIWSWFVGYVTLFGVASVDFHGFERLGRPGQLILANHPTLLDVVFILSKVPDLNCIVKKDLLNNPSMSSAILACGFIPNTESMDLVERCDEVLRSGQSLLIFPEGTRTGWDGKISFNRGPVSIGLRSASVITPIVIRVNPPNFKKGQAWYKIPKRKVHYEFIVGEDIKPQEVLSAEPLPIAARRLNKTLETYFQKETADE